MKKSNPKSRYHLSIRKKERVVEIGGGHNPHPRSNVVVDKFIESNFHRKTDIKVFQHQEFLQADGEDMPFKDKEFDYAICNQVLEHVENPIAFVKEQARVAKRGYIEVPSVIGEYLFPKEAHKWLILELNSKLVLVEKEKVGFKTSLDFGYLFLTYLPTKSMGYKILRNTHTNLMTVRYEWNDTIDIVVNPDDEELLSYFKGYWTPEMVQNIFPAKSKLKETANSVKEMFAIITGSFFRLFSNGKA